MREKLISMFMPMARKIVALHNVKASLATK